MIRNLFAVSLGAFVGAFLAFRAVAGQPPEALYLTQYDVNPPLRIADFSALVLECDNIEKVELAVTFSTYLPENSQTGKRVLGLGFSTMAGDPLIDCYRTRMLKMGAHE